MPKVLKVFETFAGIGAQHKSIKYVNSQNKDVNFKIVATSEWDARSIITYAAVHNNLDEKTIKKVLKEKNFVNENDLNEYILKHTFSLDSKMPSKWITKKDYEFKKALVVANIFNKNHSDIQKVNPFLIDKLQIDLITYSFPCQGLSVANMGRDKGINNSSSTSHLIWEIGRIINSLKIKPKYLLLENVKALIGKYYKEYEGWKKFLKLNGYKTFTAVLNARKHGSLQKRERVFALSVLEEIEVPFTNDKEYKTYLEKIGFKNILKDKKEQEKEYKRIFDILNKSNEIIESKMRNTPSRQKMIKDGRPLHDLKLAEKLNFSINTLTTRQDRFPNVGYLHFESNDPQYLNARLITPRESFKIMGFEDKDFDKLTYFINKKILNKTSLYRFAGNSIDINPLNSIFQTIINIEKINGDKNEHKRVN